MSLVVRLRGLPAVADSFDIRQFFCGFNIPRGGVYITGGKFGEAYIVFATYEDARYALTLSGHLLKNSCVHLVYSNEEEMRRALEIYQITIRPSSSSYNSRAADRNRATFSYLYLHGMPVKTTKVEIREFFKGLLVEDVLFLKFINGVRNGNAIVKFGRSTDASEGLKLNNRQICGSPLTLKLSNEVEWIKNDGENVPKRRRSPPRFSLPERRRSRSRSPVNRRTRRGSPCLREYLVHIINLSYRADKKDIKKFFFDLEMTDSQITFLVDKDGKRTREAFATFTTEKDYKRALGLNNETFKGHVVTILPIHKKAMLGLIERMKVRVCKDNRNKKKSSSQSSTDRKYLYLRNFTVDVNELDVKKFFTGRAVSAEDVTLLRDSKGVGLGEALVKFANEKKASRAEIENKQSFLGVKILMSRINEEQMKALQEANQATDPEVTEEDDMPDFTSDELPDIISIDEPPPEQNKGASTALDSKEVATRSDSESVPLEKKESDATAASDDVQATDLTEKESAEECADEANDGDDEPIYEASQTKNSAVTLLFVRNLPASVTVAEILDFFHDYKVSSVNLKNIEKGVATVRMQNYAEAESAINALNKKEVGLKPAFLSLF